MSDNWVVQNLQNALETWNEKLAEIWQLITTTPQSFKGGGIWAVIVNINGAVQAIGLAPVSYTHLGSTACPQEKAKSKRSAVCMACIYTTAIGSATFQSTIRNNRIRRGFIIF